MQGLVFGGTWNNGAGSYAPRGFIVFDPTGLPLPGTAPTAWDVIAADAAP